LLGPLEGGGPLNAVLGQTRGVGDGAKWEADLGGEEIKGALEARRELGQNHTSLALEALSSTVHNRDDGRGIWAAILTNINQRVNGAEK